MPWPAQQTLLPIAILARSACLGGTSEKAGEKHASARSVAPLDQHQEHHTGFVAAPCCAVVGLYVGVCVHCPDLTCVKERAIKKPTTLKSQPQKKCTVFPRGDDYSHVFTHNTHTQH